METVDRYGPNTSDPGKAMRFNQGKTPLSHILDWPRAMGALSEVAEYGAKKYDRGNFQSGQRASVTINSMLRHLFAWWKGEDYDKESEIHHLAHFAWNAMVLLEDALADRAGDDDRTFTPLGCEGPDYDGQPTPTHLRGEIDEGN